MVVPTSTEYTRSYKPKVFMRAGRIYDENLEFRLQKREMEQNHTTSPFMWDPSDLETDSSDRSNGSVEQQRPRSVPPHKYKHEKFNRAYQKRLMQQQQQEEEEEEEYSSPERRGRSKERRQEHSPSRSLSRGHSFGESAPRLSKPPRHTHAHGHAQTNGVHPSIHVLRDQGVQTPNWSRMKGHKTVHPSASFESSSSECPEVWVKTNKRSSSHHYQSPCSVDGHSDNVTSEKPDRWRTKHSRHKAQSSPSPESADRRIYHTAPSPSANVNGNRAVRQPASVSVTKKPPFVTYGCQYSEREIGTKKTHNVLAATDLHPTAIQALKRREIVKAIKQKQSHKKSDRPKSQQSMMSEFDNKMNKATSKWETEYQSHYPRYCDTEYERNVMSRQQTSRSGQNFWIDW